MASSPPRSARRETWRPRDPWWRRRPPCSACPRAPRDADADRDRRRDAPGDSPARRPPDCRRRSCRGCPSSSRRDAAACRAAEIGRNPGASRRGSRDPGSAADSSCRPCAPRARSMDRRRARASHKARRSRGWRPAARTAHRRRRRPRRRASAGCVKGEAHAPRTRFDVLAWRRRVPAGCSSASDRAARAPRRSRLALPTPHARRDATRSARRPRPRARARRPRRRDRRRRGS